MDYEEAYKEAIKRAKAMIKVANNQEETYNSVITIFPELKENKEEKVKRILHSIWDKMSFHLDDIFTEEEFQCFDAWSNAWLEKQGEQKAAKWSEEDEHRVKDTIYFLENAKKHYASTMEIEDCIDWTNSHYASIMEIEDCIDWINSLKQRIRG